MGLRNTAQQLHKEYTSFNSWIDEAEENISEIEDQSSEIKQEGKIRGKKVKRNEQILQELWNYVRRPNLCLISVPECDRENESKLENTLQDVIQENFPKLTKQANIQIQEIQGTPQRYFSRRATPRHIIVRFTRVEMMKKVLRAAREKGWVTHKGKTIRLTVNLSAETLQARKELGTIFNIFKEKNFQPRILPPAKLSFINEGERKSFTDQAIAERFHCHQTWLARAPERSTKQGKKQPVTATPKTYQMVKTNDAMKKLRQPWAKQLDSNKMAWSNSSITILTLNVNGLNAPIKRHRQANWMKIQDPLVCCIQETHLMYKDTYRLKIKG